MATARAEKTPTRIQNREDSTLFSAILNSHLLRDVATDVPVLFLNQPNTSIQRGTFVGQRFQSVKARIKEIGKEIVTHVQLKGTSSSLFTIIILRNGICLAKYFFNKFNLFTIQTLTLPMLLTMPCHSYITNNTNTYTTYVS